MITIAIVNTKGGVGRTTLSAALAVCAAKEGARVAMVDLDPQKSLVDWWKRRAYGASGLGGNPTIYQGCDDAADAVERALTTDAEVLILDGPPAFLTVIEAMIKAADFTVIPVKAAVMDLLASEDAITLARDNDAAHLVVLNDVGDREKDKAVKRATETLFSHNVPIAAQVIMHRTAHVTGMNGGKVAAEVRGGKTAAEEIANLWAEVKAKAMKVAKARAGKVVAYG